MMNVKDFAHILAFILYYLKYNNYLIQQLPTK